LAAYAMSMFFSLIDYAEIERRNVPALLENDRYE